MEIKIRGLVQGVGFRPFIYRLAHDMCLDGEVYNSPSGVTVIIGIDDADTFISRIRAEAPSVAVIESVEIVSNRKPQCSGFYISPSHCDDGVTQVSPDIAICPECLAEYEGEGRRENYPFVNCTNCGPRFSIIDSLPYDRINTSMNRFEMCGDCRCEYENPLDRRFHAQPIACDSCGPHYSSDILQLEAGTIVMLKGIGGYNLICNAEDEEAVARLRVLKHRPRKPFAVMVRDIATAQKLVKLSSFECDTLLSWRRPILLAPRREMDSLTGVAPRYSTLGVMLPYMAIHYSLLARKGLRAIVVTSANYPHSPMIISDDEALEYASFHNLPIISYDRMIVNRVDDSVVQVGYNQVMVTRRGRGYAPQPIIDSSIKSGIVAMGAEINSAFAISVPERIILSQYIGSLQNLDDKEEYLAVISRFKHIFGITPQAIVIDAHPLYASSRLGTEMSGEMPLIKVWHHHAHAVAVMAEYHLSGDCLALCLDGTGLGTDGNIWGGELLLCNFTSFSRLYHLPYLPMPGGDAAAVECWRMAVSLVYHAMGNINALPSDFVARIGTDNILAVCELIDKKINSPLSSSAGRLFDAVASLIGVSDYNTYESESPILLEQIADGSIADFYDISYGYQSLLTELLDDYQAATPLSIIAAKFHNSLAELLIARVILVSHEYHTSRLLLSGGVFQNRLLSKYIFSHLLPLGFEVYLPSISPCNDAGIALGQVKIASEILKSH